VETFPIDEFISLLTQAHTRFYNCASTILRYRPGSRFTASVAKFLVFSPTVMLHKHGYYVILLQTNHNLYVIL